MSGKSIKYSNSYDTTVSPGTLVDLLRSRAANRPGRLAYTFLTDGETEEVSLTYGELDRQARAIAAGLQRLVAPGERVLLLYPPGVDYIAGFFGCLYAGVVAVPAYPPKRNRNLLRLQAIVADAEASVALTTESILARMVPLFSQNPYLQPLRWLTSDSLAGGVEEGLIEEDLQEPAITGDTLAFLQYTSGSTSTPKGVMLSHGNLLYNEHAIREAFGQTEDSVILGWLPLYHDMGLIGNIIQPMFAGARCILMSPMAFLQRPSRWLQAISRFGATTSGGPNFAYDLCVRKITAEQKEMLDLSTWAVAFNGSEPIRHETIESFSASFETCGFRKSAFYPCYGLAEATLLVSGHVKGEEPVVKAVDARALETNCVLEAASSGESVRTLIGCGRSLPGQNIAIVNPESLTLCDNNQVGEIWVSGPGVAQGYWNREQETERTFQARLSDTGDGPFLRTGDLGFLRDAQLFVTGRLKDLIIIRGLNHYPQDIEMAVENCHPALRPGCGAAFSVEVAGEEQLVVVHELEHRRQVDADEVIEMIGQALAEEHELQLHAVALVKHGSIPKTSSGKIQRHACRAAFLEKSLDIIAERRATAPPNGETMTLASTAPPDSPEAIEDWLRSQLAGKVGTDSREIDVNRPIARYALDSLAAIELMYTIEVNFGVSLPMPSFMQDLSIAQIAARVLELSSCGSHNREASLVASRELADDYALSYGQQALWFLYQVAPENPAYNIVSAVRTLSDVDASALRNAFQALVARHSSLRATFAAREGKPVQQVHTYIEVPFQYEDATEWTEAQLHERLADQAHHSFDLERDPLIRLSLFRRSVREHVLLIVVHHIVADFWSLAILMHEMGMLYEAERTGSPITLTPYELQYTDYVRWQQEMLTSPEGERLRTYWKGQLSGQLPALNLPTDRPRPPVQTYRGASQSIKLDADLTRNLKALSHRYSSTQYTTLLAAFQVFLHRYTGQEEILVGSPTAGRNWAELKGLIGYFVNPVVLKANLSGDLTFEMFIEQVRKTVLDALQHQDYPFPLLVEQLQPERDASRSPLFQVMFILQKAHLLNEESLASFAVGEQGARIKIADLEMESLAIEQRVAQFDLTLMVAEANGEIAGSLQYNTDLFDGDTIKRMADHFQVLLRAIVEDPTRRISDLPLLTAPERFQLLEEWNDTHVEYPSGRCIHHLFEDQVKRTPDSVAIVFKNRALTYRELNARANRLAHYLQASGVGRESLVGICLERNIEMLVGMLATFKAGAAYVPLDPAYPKQRLAYILEDAQAELILTEERLLDVLPERCPRIICLEAHKDEIEKQCEDQPVSHVGEGNLAYIIYTSGSTGRPKGVAIEHHSAVTLLSWAMDFYDPEHLAGVLASTSICFDLSVFELFTPLSCGGKIILVDNALQLAGLSSSDKVTLVNTVPSAMTELIRAGAVPDSVRVVNLAGEPLQLRLAQDIHAQQGVEKVMNLYGPSEDTTYSTYAELRRGDREGPPIGRPIANTCIYLLDSHLQPVAVGVGGELYIGGDGLARGYLNQPALTAEKFVPDPFNKQPGGRLYKTGDLASYRPDGNIDYLGRIDHQVKIRGYRIELGEIDAVLRQHDGVRDAVALVREDKPGDKRIAVYVVAEPGHSPAISELRRFLKEKLPEYMVPSAFVMLDALPSTPTGKLNRAALPAPSGNLLMPDAETAYLGPQTEVEQIIASVWREALQLEKVGVHDNFFDLGGHSLLLIEVNSKLRDILNVDLPLVETLRHTTISLLAQYLNQNQVEQTSFQQRYDRAENFKKAARRRRQIRSRNRAEQE